MGQFMILLHKIVGFKVVAILLTVAMGAMIFQLSGPFKAHALNVHIEVKATPPGIVKIIDRSGDPPSGIVNPKGNGPTAFTTGSDTDSGTVFFGEPPEGEGEPPPEGEGEPPPEGEGELPPPPEITPPPPDKKPKGGGGGGLLFTETVDSSSGPALIINTDIDFGMIFPGESQNGTFTVTLHDCTWAEYWLNTAIGDPSSENMAPYLTVLLDSAEVAAGETDTVTFATVNQTDLSDLWWVTFLAPDEPPDFGDYSANITIEVIATYP